WTAPENWGWPPPLAIDSDNYTTQVNSDTGEIILISALDAKLNVRIEKRIRVTADAGAIQVTYRIMNEAGETQSFAPWEISRVAKGGTTFYRQGSAAINARNRGVMELQQANGICAYHHPTHMTDDAKLFDTSADNWIAHTNGHLLFIKQYDPCTTPAPGEADIEIYACPNYVEVEQQGTFAPIAPGDSTSWNVIWSLHQLPQNIKTSDPAALAGVVDGILKNRL
ncbi:MAG: hypothetical protein JXR76_09845, partial [Deltaproteobacteria bacterium]|nr:hypothetical protein [Deltaproteobacteria bacterium]